MTTIPLEHVKLDMVQVHSDASRNGCGTTLLAMCTGVCTHPAYIVYNSDLGPPRRVTLPQLESLYRSWTTSSTASASAPGSSKPSSTSLCTATRASTPGQRWSLLLRLLLCRPSCSRIASVAGPTTIVSPTSYRTATAIPITRRTSTAHFVPPTPAASGTSSRAGNHYALSRVSGEEHLLSSSW